jgi:hypothetical protein
MALETVYLDPGINMAPLTEVLVAAQYAIVFVAGVAVHAISQTELAAADAFVHGFITLMQ